MRGVSSMKSHTKLLLAEAIVILTPVSLVALTGGGYIILLQLGEKIGFTPTQSILLILFTTVLLASLVSLWVILIRVISGGSRMSYTSKLPYLLADTGAFISIIILAAILYTVFFGGSDKIFNYAINYAWGTPALIPYVHLSYLNGGILTKCC